MKVFTVGFIVVIGAASFLIAYGCCKVASIWDEWEEKIFRDLIEKERREKDGRPDDSDREV